LNLPGASLILRRMMIIENNNVLITGAAKRIGRAIAIELARAGWNVGVHYHKSHDQALTLVKELQGLGVKAVALPATLSDEAKVEKLFSAAVDALGPITCLINNASVFEEDTALNVSRNSWHGHMDVNLRAPFLLSQCLAKGLPDSSFASIVNIVDQRVWNPTSQFTSYTLSKMGLWNATQLLARSLAPRIRVNAIGPGPTLQSVHQSAEDFAREANEVPLKREVKPQDISRGVLFILQSPTMTGQMIALDSGQHLGPIRKK
jgi:NAD(P)-dependent dehydrogenase (short-subunit alcohol dehydrogenase family)